MIIVYIMMKCLMWLHFIFRVSEHQEENNMDGRNLSRCWWPTIMRMEFTSYESMLQFSAYPEDIVLTLIQQCHFFFFGGNEVWRNWSCLLQGRKTLCSPFSVKFWGVVQGICSHLQRILWGNEDTLSLFHQCNLLLQPITEGGDVSLVHTVHRNSLKWKSVM